MSEQHTPGPWLCQSTDVEGPDYGVSIIGDNLGGLVGAALPWPTEIDSGDMSRVEANARLLAAAPELLDALQIAMQWIKAWDVGFLFDDEWPADEAKINVAIAKALPPTEAKGRGDGDHG